MNRFEAFKVLSQGRETEQGLTPDPHASGLKLALSATPFILYGPPGTGKSRTVDLILKSLEDMQKLGRMETIQFHRKFSYEDFIEGYKPFESGFIPKEGIFKKFCREVSDPDLIDVFVIDEINRADLASTFGEALYALEDRDSRTVTTAHLQESFRIPRNLLIIGTMNTADRSVANVDFAVRRRFKFLPVFPNKDDLRKWLMLFDWNIEEFSLEDYCDFAARLNSRISQHPMLGYHMQLGNSLFVPKASTQALTIASLCENFSQAILPQLEAYVGLGNREGLARLTNPPVAEAFLKYHFVHENSLAGHIRESSSDKSTLTSYD